MTPLLRFPGHSGFCAARNTARLGTYLYHEFIAINNTFNQPMTPQEITHAKKSSQKVRMLQTLIFSWRETPCAQNSLHICKKDMAMI